MKVKIYVGLLIIPLSISVIYGEQIYNETVSEIITKHDETGKAVIFASLITLPKNRSNSSDFRNQWKIRNRTIAISEFRLEKDIFSTIYVEDQRNVFLYSCELTENDKIMARSPPINKSRTPIDIMEQGKLLVEVNVNEDATWKIELRQNISVSFLLLDRYGYIQDGFLFSNTTPTVYSMTRANVTMNDTLSYNLIAYKENIFENRTIVFKVRSKPSAKIRLHPDNKWIVTAEVTALGVEEKNEVDIIKQVQFEYVPCDHKAYALCNHNTSMKLDWKLTTVERNVDRITTSLRFFPNNSGFVVLTASNKLGETRKTRRICVSDGPDQLTGNETNLIAGNEATMFCVISTCKYNETAGILWYYSATDNQPLDGAVVHNGKQSIKSTITIPKVQLGKYICTAQLLENKCNTCDKKFEFSSFDGRETEILGYANYVIGVAFGLLLMLLVSCYYSCKRKKSYKKQMPGCNRQTGEQYFLKDKVLQIFPIDSKWKFPSENLKLEKVIGCGNFGVVMSAEACGILEGEDTSRVAVKMARRHSDQCVKELLEEELVIMSNLDRHLHIVNLLGALKDKDLMIIFEMCIHGSLNNYIQQNRYRFGSQRSKDEVPTLKFDANIMVFWSFQIATGMDWLASKGIVHGDLATRNILLTTANIVKISDFGLSSKMHSSYVRRDIEQLGMPLKWMAIESIRNGKFSTHSDVWSYSITLWEIFSLGNIPYHEFETFREMWTRLQGGYRLIQPKYCPDTIFELMVQCWNEDPDKRPPFLQLSKSLFEMMDKETQKEYHSQLEGFAADDRNLYGRGLGVCNNMDMYQDIVAEQQPLPQPYGIIDTYIRQKL